MSNISYPSIPASYNNSGQDYSSLSNGTLFSQVTDFPVPFVGDGNVSDTDTLALMQMGAGLTRLAELAGLAGSSVLQGVALAYERASLTPREDKIAALFNLAAALGYTGTYSLDALSNWIDTQTKEYESRLEGSTR